MTGKQLTQVVVGAATIMLGIVGGNALSNILGGIFKKPEQG